MPSPTLTRLLTRAGRLVASLALFAGVPALPAMMVLSAPPSAIAQDKVAGEDVLVLKSGKSVTGKIIEETATQVRIQISIGSLTSIVQYERSEIMSITRGTGQPAAAPDPKTPSKPVLAAAADPSGPDKKRIYTLELTGWFGEDISETPIRESVKDAKRNNADVLIVVIDNDWSLRRFGRLDDIKDDVGQFDQLFRAEKMAPIFNDEIPKEWTKQPQIVFWVKKAMGGAAFLPLNCRTIYFHSEGKMGGIGHLSKIFGSMGDKVVREKQFSLRLGHAEGMAIQGGYAPQLVKAMARDEYVLSYKIEGGKPIYLERMPQAPDEFLLTDDGDEQEGRADDITVLARGEGNDVLTLTADLAFKLLVSKGTTDTMDDLIYKLGISRNSEMIKGKSAQIMKSWRDGVDDAKRKLPKLWQDYRDVTVAAPGGFNERTQARNKQRSICTEMQALWKKYEEALSPNEIRAPGWADLNIIKERLKTEQLADKPEKK